MTIPSRDEIQRLLAPYLETPVPSSGPTAEGTPGLDLRREELSALLPRLQAYLELLQRWGERTNLTAIRRPEEQVTRHFGESLYAARVLAPQLQPGDTVLDLGSGAGFPGLPLQLLLPELKVTLAESQGKKAAFLREAVRTLGVNAKVWADRAEDLPPALRFSAVALRAVDRPRQALEEARRRVERGGWLLHLRGAGEDSPERVDGGSGEVLEVRMPGLQTGWVRLLQC